VLAAALLKFNPASAGPSSPPTIYIIAPHTAQSIPMLHALLANTISDSQAALDLLRSVRLLQYFDLAGLAESVAEVSEQVYRASQIPDATKSGSAEAFVVIQGIGTTVSAAHRRSGLVQANALLAGLTRNIAQLSRSSPAIPVIVEIPIEIEDVSDEQRHQDGVKSRVTKGMDLESAFLGSTGETLRLSSGHQTLSRTLEAGLDCLVVVHDGLGRMIDSKSRQKPSARVVEAIKDRSGDLTGLWDIWKAA
jgi:hypothetical protein